MIALYVVRSSVVPRKDFARRRITSRQQALEISLEIIGNQAIGEEEGFDVGSNDGFHDLGDWSVVAGNCFCAFFMQSGSVC